MQKISTWRNRFVNMEGTKKTTFYHTGCFGRIWDLSNDLLLSPHKWIVSSPFYPQQPVFLSLLKFLVQKIQKVIATTTWKGNISHSILPGKQQTNCFQFSHSCPSREERCRHDLPQVFAWQRFRNVGFFSSEKTGVFSTEGGCFGSVNSWLCEYKGGPKTSYK